MTKAQKLEAIAQAGVDGAAVVRFTPELSQWDPETFVRTVLVDWLRVAEVWVGANFLFGHDRSGNFTLLRIARRALRVQGREDRSGPLQGLRRQQHAHPAADRRRARGRGRRAARPSVLRSTARSSAATERGRTIGFPTANLLHRERAAAAATASMRRRVGIDGVIPSGRHQHRRAADRSDDVAAHGRSRRTSSISTAICTARPLRLGFVQRLRDERRVRSLDALRAQIAADMRPGARAVRAAFTVESRWLWTRSRFVIRADALPAIRGDAAKCLADVAATSAARAQARLRRRRASTNWSSDGWRPAARSKRVAGRRRRADCRRAGSAAERRCDRSKMRRRRAVRRPRSCQRLAATAAAISTDR